MTRQVVELKVRIAAQRLGTYLLNWSMNRRPRGPISDCR